MNKSELVHNIHMLNGHTKASIDRFITTFVTTIHQHCLYGGEVLSIKRFGKFERMVRVGRTIPNRFGKTSNEVFKTEDTFFVKFTPSYFLMQWINANKMPEGFFTNKILIGEWAYALELSDDDVKTILNDFLSIICLIVIIKKEPFAIIGLGRFIPKYHKQKTIRNPQNGETTINVNYWQFTFKPYDSMKVKCRHLTMFK